MIEISNQNEELDISTQIQERPNLRNIKQPDTSNLTNDQGIAYERLREFIKSGEQMFCFEGFAGVGKSFCINMFMEELIFEYGAKICACAPTHKAKVVLKQMAEFKSENLDYNTIHSLLGLKPIINARGEEQFVRDKTNKTKVDDYDYIFIDEASMLDDALFSYIIDVIDENPYIKIIFIGDHKQLPPVKHTCSAPMDEKRREKHGIKHSLLTKIVRQKGTNPIIALSKDLREYTFKPKTTLNDDGHGIIVVNKKDYTKVIEKMFTSGDYEKNPNYCRAVAWTNDCVNEFNVKIRKMIYRSKIEKDVKDLRSKNMSDADIASKLSVKYPFYNKGVMNLPKYVVGDKLIADKPIFHSECAGTIVFQTNEEMIITDLKVDARIGLGNYYQCYVATVKNLYTGKVEEIEIIHEASDVEYNQHLDKLRKLALEVNPKNNALRVSKWKTFYSLDKRFARLKYAPCLTTYKSQGSTYDNIIIIIPDIIKNPKKREMFQHLYVGVTRASKRAFILI